MRASTGDCRIWRHSSKPSISGQHDVQQDQVGLRTVPAPSAYRGAVRDLRLIAVAAQVVFDAARRVRLRPPRWRFAWACRGPLCYHCRGSAAGCQYRRSMIQHQVSQHQQGTRCECPDVALQKAVRCPCRAAVPDRPSRSNESSGAATDHPQKASKGSVKRAGRDHEHLERQGRRAPRRGRRPSPGRSGWNHSPEALALAGVRSSLHGSLPPMARRVEQQDVAAERAQHGHEAAK